MFDAADLDIPKRRSMGSHQSARAISHTWLTPPEIIEALGPFDLDPCACPEPRPWSTAAVHWTREDQPLSREWPDDARTWVNPPFGPKATVAAFMARVAKHGRGTALLFGRTDTALFHDFVFSQATAILFLRGRPHFHRQDGTRAAANSGAPVVLIAYGGYDAKRLLMSGLPGHCVELRDWRI